MNSEVVKTLVFPQRGDSCNTRPLQIMDGTIFVLVRWGDGDMWGACLLTFAHKVKQKQKVSFDPQADEGQKRSCELGKLLIQRVSAPRVAVTLLVRCR